LVVVGLVAAAGCFGGGPPPASRPTQQCGLGFGSARDYQSAFDALGHADTGWITADGFVPPVLPDGRAQLPDGRVVWWMSDTMTGSVSSGNYVPNPVNVHDSTVEPGGGCLTPHLGVIPYSPSVWYWPGSAVVEGNILQVFSYKVVPDSSHLYPYDWRVVGTSVTNFSLPSLQLVGGPTDLPVLKNPTGEIIPWGIRSFFNADDGNVYLYGTTIHPTDFVPASNAWLARAPAGQVTNQSAWQYFTDSTLATLNCPIPPLSPWSSNFACARPMEFTKADSSPDGSPLAQLSVVPYGSGYLAGAFGWDTLSTGINAWTAPQPEGPWKRVENADGAPHAIATFPPKTNNQFAYDARIVQLPGPAGWTVVYGANDPNGQKLDFTLYRGQFATPNGLPPP